MANIASFYGQWNGAEGLKAQANRLRTFTNILIEEFTSMGIVVVTDHQNHFDTLTIDAQASGFSSSDYLISEFHKFGMNLRKVDDKHVGISLNETTSLVDLDEIIEIMSDLKGAPVKSGFLTEAFYENRKV